jgi:hypothetical protein
MAMTGVSGRCRMACAPQPGQKPPALGQQRGVIALEPRQIHELCHAGATRIRLSEAHQIARVMHNFSLS